MKHTTQRHFYNKKIIQTFFLYIILLLEEKWTKCNNKKQFELSLSFEKNNNKQVICHNECDTMMNVRSEYKKNIGIGFSNSIRVCWKFRLGTFYLVRENNNHTKI